MSEKPNTKTRRDNTGSSPSSGSRFSPERVEELLQSRDILSDGDDVSYEDARDLVLWYGDELDRVNSTYQRRLMDIANQAVKAIRYPENTKD